MISKVDKVPEDLGIKIGTKEESFWTDLKVKVEGIIYSAKKEIIIQEKLLALCNEKIKEEKEKLK